MRVRSVKNVVLPLIFLLLSFASSTHIHHKHGKIFLGIGAECKDLEEYSYHCGPGLWCGPNGVCEVENSNKLHNDEHLDDIFTEDVSVKHPFHEDSEHLILESGISPQTPSVIDELLRVNEDNRRTPSFEELLHGTDMIRRKHDSSPGWARSFSEYQTNPMHFKQDHVSSVSETMDYATGKEHKTSMPIITTPHPLDDQELKSIVSILPIIRHFYGDKFSTPTPTTKPFKLFLTLNSHKTTISSLNGKDHVTPESSASSHSNSGSQGEKWRELMKIASDVSVRSRPYHDKPVIENPLFVDSSTEDQSIVESTSTQETHTDPHEANPSIGSAFGVSSDPDSHSEMDSPQDIKEVFTPQELRGTLEDAQLSNETLDSVADADFLRENTSSIKFISTTTTDVKLSSSEEHLGKPVPSESSDEDSLSPKADENPLVDLTPLSYDVTPTPCSEGQTENFQRDSACSLQFIPLPSYEKDKEVPTESSDSDVETPVHLLALNTPLPDVDDGNENDKDVDRDHKNDIVTVVNSSSVDNAPTFNFHSSPLSQTLTKPSEVNSTEHEFNPQSIVPSAETPIVSSLTQQPAPALKANQVLIFSSSLLKHGKPSPPNICSHVLMRVLNPLCFFINLLS